MLNPLSRIDQHIMDDADLAGPVLYTIFLGFCLLFVSQELGHFFVSNCFSLERSISAIFMVLPSWDARLYG